MLAWFLLLGMPVSVDVLLAGVNDCAHLDPQEVQVHKLVAVGELQIMFLHHTNLNCPVEVDDSVMAALWS